jgi:pimeloyl-ACP methyl ester carboxylesterase
LFTGLVLFEPIIAGSKEVLGIGREKVALMAIKRKRVWESRKEAETYFNKAWVGWDARVREKWNGCALLEVEGGDGKVELAWGRDKKLAVYMDMSEMRESAATIGSVEGKGKDSAVWTTYPTKVWESLKNLVVPVAFVCGQESTSSTVKCKKYWDEETGTNRTYWPRGFERRVELVEVKGAGHLVPFERPRECAGLSGAWIEGVVRGWWKKWAIQRNWREMRTEEREKVVANWMMDLKSRI